MLYIIYNIYLKSMKYILNIFHMWKCRLVLSNSDINPQAHDFNLIYIEFY